MIFIFNGPPGSGKDEAAAYMQSQLGCKHKSFKTVLIEKTVEHFDVSYEWFIGGYSDRQSKERKEACLGDRSRREALIYVSEDICKPRYGNDYFGVAVCEGMDSVSDYCFSDGGFVEEIVPIINMVGTDNISIIHLTRNGASYVNDSRRYVRGIEQDEFVINHKTKVDRQYFHPEQLPVRTYWIHNNGTIGEFHQSIRNVYIREKHVVKTYKGNVSRKPI